MGPFCLTGVHKSEVAYRGRGGGGGGDERVKARRRGYPPEKDRRDRGGPPPELAMAGSVTVCVCVGGGGGGGGQCVCVPCRVWQRRCPLAIAQRLVHCAGNCCFNCRAWAESQGQCPLHCCG